jgi:hypothetical protein
MDWTKRKPTESGWYEYAGELSAVTKESEPMHCNPACRVAVHFSEKPFIAIYRDPELYDYEMADGLWSRIEEPLEEPSPGELSQNG